MRIQKMFSISGGLETGLGNGSLEVIEKSLGAIALPSLEAKISKEAGRKGQKLWSPQAINDAFEINMKAMGWKEYKEHYYLREEGDDVSAENTLTREQLAILAAQIGRKRLRSYTQSDFLLNKIVIEIQLGKYPFVLYDILVKNSILHRDGIIDAAIEIVPMKELQAKMSSGPSYFEWVVDKALRMEADQLPKFPTLIVGIC